MHTKIKMLKGKTPTLSAEHAALLAASAINEAVIKTRGYWTANAQADLLHLGFKLHQCQVPALVIPIRNVHGEISLYQIRPDKPRTSKNGRTVKYEIPYGGRLVLDVPLMARPNLRDPKIPLFITEGARKADAAVSKGLCCISLLGVWNWRGKNEQGGTAALSDWDAIPLNNRQVYLAFDSDMMTKKSVRMALARLMALMRGREAKVQVIHLPAAQDGSKVGLDDYLADGHTVEDLLKLATMTLISSPRKDQKPPEGGENGCASGGEDHLPTVVWKDRSLHEVAEEVLQAVRRKNQIPEVFQYNELLVRLRRQRKTGALTIESMTPDAFRGWLDRVADWNIEDEYGMVRTPPPMSIVKDIMNLPGWNPAIIPILERVTQTPIFTADGKLIDKQGYDATARVYYDPPADLQVPTVAPVPTEEDVNRAKGLFFDHLFKDFPFKDDKGASKAHALAALLLHFLRDMIDGPTPLHLIDAAKPGTGKGLLADAIVIPATGREAETTPPPRNEEEMRKALTAALMEGPSHITLDNLSGDLDSAALANCLTSPQWTDRVLGASKKVHLSINCTWLATGNNVKLSTELTRRTLWIRLESPLERPWERNPAEFTHHPLHIWARGQRGHLIWAALTLIQNWIAKGRPAGSKTLGRFESWATVMSGVLEAAQIDSLLANAEDLYDSADETADQWRAFTRIWDEHFGDVAVGTKELFPLVQNEELLPSVVPLEEEEDKARKKFGRALAKQVGTCYGGKKILAAGKDSRAGTRLYKLVGVGSENKWSNKLPRGVTLDDVLNAPAGSEDTIRDEAEEVGEDTTLENELSA